MRDVLIHFLNRIKDYENESGHSMHEDERESSEIVDIHLHNVPELKNYVPLSNVELLLPNDEAIEQWWSEGKESDKFWQDAPYRTNSDVVEEIKTALKYFILYGNEAQR